MITLTYIALSVTLFVVGWINNIMEVIMSDYPWTDSVPKETWVALAVQTIMVGLGFVAGLTTL